MTAIALPIPHANLVSIPEQLGMPCLGFGQEERSRPVDQPAHAAQSMTEKRQVRARHVATDRPLADTAILSLPNLAVLNSQKTWPKDQLYDAFGSNST